MDLLSFNKRGIFFIFILFFPLLLISQRSNWHVGIGIRPSTLGFDPYNIIAKKKVSNKWAWRMGLGGIYSRELQIRKDERHVFIDPVPKDEVYYSTSKSILNLSVNGFVGLQYYFKLRNINIYAGSDIGIGYQLDKDFYNKIDNHNVSIIVRSNDIIITATTHDFRYLKFSIRPSIGFEYKISSSFSCAIESGIQYFKNKLYRKSEEILYVSKDSFGGGMTPSRIDWDSSLLLSPITFINFYYHF